MVRTSHGSVVRMKTHKHSAGCHLLETSCSVKAAFVGWHQMHMQAKACCWVSCRVNPYETMFRWASDRSSGKGIMQEAEQICLSYFGRPAYICSKHQDVVSEQEILEQDPASLGMLMEVCPRVSGNNFWRPSERYCFLTSQSVTKKHPFSQPVRFDAPTGLIFSSHHGKTYGTVTIFLPSSNKSTVPTPSAKDFQAPLAIKS